MEFTHKNIETEYYRWIKKIGTPNPFNRYGVIELKDVLRAHFLIIDFFIENGEYGIGGIGPRDLNLLDSVTERQFTSYDGREKWTTHFQKCATLLYGIIMDHPFHDANKRTGFLIALYYLDKINMTLNVGQKEFEELIVNIAKGNLKCYPRYRDKVAKGNDPEVLFIAEYLQKNTKKIDKRSYNGITFSEVDKLLRIHGYGLSNPHKSSIDVVKIEIKKSFFSKNREQVKKQLTTINFPGWKKEMGKGTLKEVRRVTQLTPENGYDSRIFFQGLSSFRSLIYDYSAPLKRLANR